MKERVLAGVAALTLAFAGFTGINQASTGDGVVPSLMVHAVSTTQGDSLACLAAKRSEHTAKAVTKAGEWRTETINLEDQPSEFGYMIASTRGQTPTSLAYFGYQDQSTSTTTTVSPTKAVGPQVAVAGDGVARKAAPGGNTAAGTTSFTASQEPDVTFYSKPYPLGKTTVAADSSAQLGAILSGDVTPDSGRYVVAKNDNRVGSANATIVNKDDLEESGRLEDSGGKKDKPGSPCTGAAI